MGAVCAPAWHLACLPVHRVPLEQHRGTLVSLALVGAGASYEFRWRRWALLRDTVAAHFEDGVAGTRFPTLLAIGAGSVRVPANEFAFEIVKIRELLRGCAIEGLRISHQTSTILYQSAVPGSRPLRPNELAQIAPVGDARDLEEYFSSMLDSFADVCAPPAADGTVEALDG